jgi:hypothetical protein
MKINEINIKMNKLIHANKFKSKDESIYLKIKYLKTIILPSNTNVKIDIILFIFKYP